MAHGNATSGDDLLDGVHRGAQHVTEPLRLQEQALVPVLLILTGKARKPAMAFNSFHKRREDGPEGIAKTPIKKIGS
jgi:hypothetical protein